MLLLVFLICYSVNKTHQCFWAADYQFLNVMERHHVNTNKCFFYLLHLKFSVSATFTFQVIDSKVGRKKHLTHLHVWNKHHTHTTTFRATSPPHETINTSQKYRFDWSSNNYVWFQTDTLYFNTFFNPVHFLWNITETYLANLIIVFMLTQLIRCTQRKKQPKVGQTLAARWAVIQTTG